MRDVSDRLCREPGLSVIKNPEGKRKNYSEWSAEKNGKPTNRSRIRADIDRAIGVSLTENEFFDALEEMGYELKLTAASGKTLQRPSLRPQGSERFYRFDRLGEEYSDGTGLFNGSPSDANMMRGKRSADGKIVYWYTNDAGTQFNKSGYTYYYRALG